MRKLQEQPRSDLCDERKAKFCPTAELGLPLCNKTNAFRKASAETLLRLSRVLGCTMEDLIEK